LARGLLKGVDIGGVITDDRHPLAGCDKALPAGNDPALLGQAADEYPFGARANQLDRVADDCALFVYGVQAYLAWAYQAKPSR
jgi:hypothetical protein